MVADSKRILFASHRGSSGYQEIYNHHLVGPLGSEIRVLDLTTRQTTTLTTVPPSSDYPSWGR